jgi:hypothetical protein
MLARHLTRLLAFFAALGLTVMSASAFDETQYPDWSGQWWRPRGVGFQWDPTRPPGLGQQAPLTAEYQAVLEASLADQAAGGQGGDTLVTCRTNGLPRMMSVAWPIEFVILPKVTYVHFEVFMPRRIYTDGRDFPKDGEPGPSANGSIPTTTAVTTPSRSRPATSKGRAPTSPAASRCTTIISRSSRNAFFSTSRTRMSCTTRSPCSTTR